MDIRDYKKGAREDFFWFEAKRELIGILLRRLSLHRNARILNVGAGTGEDIRVIRDFGEVYAVDLNAEALSLIPDDLVSEKIQCDVCKLPYSDGFFDSVLAFDVFEHIKDDSVAVSEIKRVLKKSGNLVFTVPTHEFLYSAHDRMLGHIRRYNKSKMKVLLKGFDCIDSGYWMSIMFVPIAIQRYFQRKKVTEVTQFANPGSFLNNILLRILRIENWLVSRGFHLPVGMTLYGICRKQG